MNLSFLNAVENFVHIIGSAAKATNTSPIIPNAAVQIDARLMVRISPLACGLLPARPVTPLGSRLPVPGRIFDHISATLATTPRNGSDETQWLDLKTARKPSP